MTTSSKAVRLLTGPSGSGKTSLLATLFAYVWKRYKKKSRLYTADGGGYGNKMQNLIDLGIVEHWRMRTRFGAGGEDLTEETFQRASHGYWPESFSAPGETLPNTKLVEPIIVTFSLFCPDGHLAKQRPTQREIGPMVCPVCKKSTTLQNGRVEKTAVLAPHMDGVGAVAFEGLTSWSDIFLNALRERRARGTLRSAEGAAMSFRSGDMEFAGGNRSDYGIAQGEAERWIQNSTTIPGLVVEPMWTGLETSIEESGTAQAFWAPAIAGQARAGKVPQWVGDWLGAQTVIVDGVRRHRLYTTEYRGEDGLPHKYKSRCEPGYLPDFLEDSGGVAFSGFSLGVYLEMIEAATSKGLENAAKEFPDAPGLQKGGAGVVSVVVPSVPAPGPVAVPAGSGGTSRETVTPGAGAPNSTVTTAVVATTPTRPPVSGRPTMPPPRAPGRPPMPPKKS